MDVVPQLCTHPAWQPQFRELQQSQRPHEVALRAALHNLFRDVTKLLPEHVSQAITACFLFLR